MSKKYIAKLVKCAMRNAVVLEYDSLLYAIKQCTAPCAAKIPKDAYAADIRNLTRFLDGSRESVLKEREADIDRHFPH